MKRGSVVAVTGANSGMGKEISVALAKAGATVVMICRSQPRGAEALQEVQQRSGSDSVELMLCDLASLQSVRKFCPNFRDKHQRLDVLINNAGVVLPGRHETADQYELQFGVNHLGHFLLTNLLLDLMVNSAPARIINVSSGAHKAGRIHFEDVNLKKNYNVWRAYAQSKLANILFTYELADRLKGTGVTANCLHPGAVATNMGINRDTGFGTMITRMLKPFFQTSEQGASTAIYLAVSDEVEGITGKYYYRSKPTESSPRSYDKAAANKLWELSEQMTALQRQKG